MKARNWLPPASIMFLTALSLASPVSRRMCAAWQGGKQTQPLKAQMVAFVGVNVVPMDRERFLPEQTVVIDQGRIAAIGPTDKTAVPKNAMPVDGRGKYLTPGLADL